jgi:ABC-type phosphate transport system substrate-binding protein
MHQLRILFALAAPLVLAAPGAWAQSPGNAGVPSFVVQGSTTFTHQVMEPYQGAIEKAAGVKLTVVPSKSSLGVLALFEKRGDFAMISGPLDNEIAELKSAHPALDFGRLKTFEVANTRMAFAINKDNPVTAVSDDTMRQILLGAITNWHEVGGPDRPIRIVIVRGGGGVQASIENELLHGKRIAAPNPIVVQISSQVIKVTEQLPEALGLSQLSIVAKSTAHELKTDHPIVQRLALLTLGDPTPIMRRVIEAAHKVMADAPQ